MSKKLIASLFLVFIFLGILGSEKAEAYNEANGLYNNNELTSMKDLNSYSPNFLTTLKTNEVVELAEKYTFTPTITTETVVTYRNGGRGTMNTVTAARNAAPIRFIGGLTNSYSSNNFVYATNMGRMNGRSIDVQYTILSSTGAAAQYFNFGLSTNPNEGGLANPLFTVSRADRARPTLRVEYFDSETKSKIPMGSGHLTYNNLDNSEWVNLQPVGTQASLDQIYVMDNTTTRFINRNQNKPYRTDFTIVGQATGENNMEAVYTIATMTFSDVTELIMTYRTATSSLLRPGVYQLPGLTYEYTTPSIFTNKVGVEQSETAFVFNVNQSIPNVHRNSPQQLNLLNFRISDIDSRLVLDSSQIRVFDSTGVDVSRLFNITTLNGVVDVNWRGTELLSLSGKSLNIRLPVNFPISNYTENQLANMYDYDKKVFTFENINASRSYRVGNQAVRQASALKDDEIDLAYAQRNLTVNFLENQTNNVLEPAITNAFFQRTVSLTAWREVVEKDQEILELKYRINSSRSPSYRKPVALTAINNTVNYVYDPPLYNLEYKVGRKGEHLILKEAAIKADNIRLLTSFKVIVPTSIEVADYDKLVLPTSWRKTVDLGTGQANTYTFSSNQFTTAAIEGFLNNTLSFNQRGANQDGSTIDITLSDLSFKNKIPQPIIYDINDSETSDALFPNYLEEKSDYYFIDEKWSEEAPEITNYSYVSGFREVTITDAVQKFNLLYKLSVADIKVSYYQKIDGVETDTKLVNDLQSGLREEGQTVKGSFGTNLADFITREKLAKTFPGYTYENYYVVKVNDQVSADEVINSPTMEVIFYYRPNISLTVPETLNFGKRQKAEATNIYGLVPSKVKEDNYVSIINTYENEDRKPNWTLQMSTEGFYSQESGVRLLSNLLYKKSAEEEYTVINNESQTVLNDQKEFEYDLPLISEDQSEGLFVSVSKVRSLGKYQAILKYKLQSAP